MLTGALVAVVGYLSPWFRVSSSYDWWFSGWAYATLSSGGGWTLWTLAWLTVTVGASLWAGGSQAAAMTGMISGLGAMMFSMAAVAASFSFLPKQDSINYLTALPIGIGLPLLAIGLGLVAAGGCRAIAAAVFRSRAPGQTADSLEGQPYHSSRRPNSG